MKTQTGLLYQDRSLAKIVQFLYTNQDKDLFSSQLSGIIAGGLW